MTRSFFSVVVTENPAEVAAWYCEHLGYEIVVDLEWYVHLKSKAGHEMGWMKPGLEYQPEPWQKKPTNEGFGLCFEVDDLDSEWKKWGHKQKALLKPLREDWGQYHFTVYDPAGTMVDVIQFEPMP